MEFKEGDRVVIKLHGGENYEGNFVKATNKRIEIDDIYHYDTGNKIDSVWSFYMQEIDAVYKLNNKKCRETTDQKKPEPENHILIPQEEYERLKEMANNFIYVKTDDKTYYDSVNQICNFESIGVFPIGSEKGRSGRITLLAISCWKQVYIFDWQNFRLRKFPEEIAEILESHYIKKVVHNGGALQDCLQNYHNITMNNVFDTQVAHIFIIKNTTGKCPQILKNIGECLTEYFNFPATLLTSSLSKLEEPWDARPLEEDQLKKLSRLATYLIPIKDHQMGLMMKNFDKAVMDYHNLFVNGTNFQVLKGPSNVKLCKEIDTIIPIESMSLQDTKSD